MILRSWIYLTALFQFSMSYQRIPIEQICTNLAKFYDIIYPLANMKINLLFDENSKYQYHTGNGTVLFSPNIYINHCTSQRVKDFTLVDATFTSTLTISFPKRSWVVIEECEIAVQFKTRPTLKKSGERSIKIIWVRVNQFVSASANCGYGKISQRDLKPVLNEALSKFTRPSPIFYVERNSVVIANRLSSLMEVAFKYYINRLVV